MKGRGAGATGRVCLIFSFPCDPLREEESEARMESDVQRIIADARLCPETEVILVTAEIERQVRESGRGQHAHGGVPDLEAGGVPTTRHRHLARKPSYLLASSDRI